VTAGTIVVLATGAWSALIVVVLSLGRSARRGDDLGDAIAAQAFGATRPATPRARHPEPGPRERGLLWAQLVLLVVSLAGAAVASDASQWHPAELVALLAVLAVGGDFLAVEARRFRVSGCFPALVLAMALLGPAPAVAIGVACAVSDGLRSHHSRSFLASNLATYATFPLLGALALDLLSSPAAATGPDAGYAVLVLAVFLAANALNFVLIAGHVALLRRTSLLAMVRSVFVPMLPWEVVTGLVTAIAVLGYQHSGIGVIAAFALALGICQVLLQALVEGQHNSERLTEQERETGVRHERMLGLMLHTLSLRDPTAARHAAAVAHYSLALARAAGLPEREQEVVHTAGLLHDIGKQGLPDSILIAERELSPADRRLISRHPIDGARLLREVPGLEPIADAVLAHHERVDGRGYPHGLRGEEIPVSARVVAIAEAYDALTATDSYRRPVAVDEAIAELRRCGGTQFDAALVEAFAETVARVGAAGFRRRGDADLEAELRLQRYTRELLHARP
jgi:putative nucleotidyltransferase with HDIG domain